MELGMDRRKFLKVSAAGLGTMMLPIGALSAVSSQEDPHFFLQIYIYGGIDSSFLFDGRMNDMKAKGLIHDHLKEEPKLWLGDNGTKCLATSYARKLEKHRQRFSVVNGVFMATAFDGHPQNINFLFTGDPFGGESYIAHMNERTDPAYAKRPLDAIQVGIFQIDQTNGGSTVPLTGESAFNLIEFQRKARAIDARNPVVSYLSSRFAALGAGPGRFSTGSKAMMSGYASAPDLSRKLQKVTLTPPDKHPNPEAAFIELMSGLFREGICGSAMIAVSPSFEHLDVHAGRTAKLQSQIYDSVADKVLRVFDLLAATPYDAKRSLFDVTTVMFASEFGRTLRQPNLPQNETGTDHNSLNNSLLIGGKGINGGLVIGETDWQTPDEELSGAHKILDASGLKLIGRPFDFATSKPSAEKPKHFDIEHYLNMASVVNTLYSSFTVPQAKWRNVKRDGPKAPVIKALLK